MSSDPSTEPSAFIFDGLSSRVSLLPDVESKRQLIHSEQSDINAAIKQSIDGQNPVESFAMIDCIKSLVGRELLLRQRLGFSGEGSADVFLHGFRTEQVLDTLARDPDLCAIQFYYSQDHEFWAFLGYSSDSNPKVEKVLVASQNNGRRIHDQLVRLSERKKQSPYSNVDDLLVPLLQTFGECIIPRLQRAGSIKKVLLLPHKLLYLLPLHVMLAKVEQGIAFLEAVAQVTYSSSLFTFAYHFKFGDRGKTERRRLLACVDKDNLGQGAKLELAGYRVTFGDAAGIDIVTSANEVPDDFSAYQFLIWSSHGTSNPASWSSSHLSFGEKTYSAQEIVEKWDLRNVFAAILSACETGIDKSIDDALDEYAGLDMAVHIAGADTVVSTMWPVEDKLAGLVAMFLAEGVVKHVEKASSFLRMIRFHLMSGQWKDIMEANYKRALALASTKPNHQKQLADFFDQVLSVEKDAFNRMTDWAVFRTFGDW